jgi:hypothetical protein
MIGVTAGSAEVGGKVAVERVGFRDTTKVAEKCKVQMQGKCILLCEGGVSVVSGCTNLLSVFQHFGVGKSLNGIPEQILLVLACTRSRREGLGSFQDEVNNSNFELLFLHDVVDSP